MRPLLIIYDSSNERGMIAVAASMLITATKFTDDMVYQTPVDCVSRTPRIAAFATDPQIPRKQNRVPWINGKIAQLAQQQLTANGWTSPARGATLACFRKEQAKRLIEGQPSGFPHESVA